MSITLNIHWTDKVSVCEHEADGTSWITITLQDRDHKTQDITIFDVSLYDLQHAIEQALHKDEIGIHSI